MSTFKPFQLPVGRRIFAALALMMSAATVSAASIDLGSASIADLQSAMSAGTLTSEKLVQLYLARIDAYDKQGLKQVGISKKYVNRAFRSIC